MMLDSKTVTCAHCKDEVDVFLYFSDARIVERGVYGSAGETYYEAVVNGKALCPRCGNLVKECFQKILGPADIIKLACKKGID